jgi:preprotein translocase SecF subunit
MFRIFDPSTPIDFVSKIPLAVRLAITFVIVSIGLLVYPGISWGIDFAGGTEMQVKFSKEGVGSEDIRSTLEAAGFEKQQVQRYGSEGSNEMLIRIERLTSLKPSDIQNVQDLLRGKWGELALGSDGKAEELEVAFSEEEGDRVTISMPIPKAGEPPKKNADPAAIEAHLNNVYVEAAPEGAEGAEEGAAPVKKALDDTAFGAMSAAGFDRGAVASKARELGFTVTANPTAQVEPAFNADLASDRLLDDQMAMLSKILDGESGYKLRRTKMSGSEEADTSDAVHRDEPYKGIVKYLVHFQGVSIEIEKALSDKFGVVEVRRVEFVDSKVAEQLRTDGLLAVLFALFCILVYVAVRFDIFFSPGAVIALVHDAVVALAVFPLSQFISSIEFDLPSIAAVLTVVGYSINNTIIIYDRVRETMPTDTKTPLNDEQVRGFVNQAINDTFSRTINTTLTTLFASMALWIFAGGVVRNFAIVLSVGILLGAFSSTFLAPATYLFFRKNFHNPEEAKKSKKGLSREDKARGVV